MTQVTCRVQSGQVLITTTPRLRIRDWTVDDAPTVLDIHGRVEVVKWLGDGEPVLMKDLDEARERIGKWLLRDEPPCGFWAVDVTEPGPLQGRTIGAVLLVPLPDNEHGEVEIGWHLHPDAWGHGYATEAARAVLAHGFAAGLPEIIAVSHTDNYPSQAVMRRLGMTDRGIVEKWYEGESACFVTTAQEWAAQAKSD